MSDPQQPGQHPHQIPPYVSQQPHHPQPAAPQQAPRGYVLNGQSAQPLAHSARPANPAGRVGLILGIVALGINVITSIAFQILIRGDGYQLYGLVNGIGALLAFGAALAALILGFIGLRRRDASQASAGIAAGIGLAVVVGTAFSFMINTVASVLYF